MTAAENDPVVMKLPSLLEPVFQQDCNLQGGRHSLTVLLRGTSTPFAGWTAAPRLLSIPSETTPIKNREFYSSFVRSCMAGVILQSAHSAEAVITSASEYTSSRLLRSAYQALSASDPARNR